MKNTKSKTQSLPSNEVKCPKSSILIVEDDAVISTLLKAMLSSLGYDVFDAVASGEVALQRVGVLWGFPCIPQYVVAIPCGRPGQAQDLPL